MTTETQMKDEFKHCPRCGSDKIEQTDYENEDEDDDGRRCLHCDWEGDRSELHC